MADSVPPPEMPTVQLPESTLDDVARLIASEIGLVEPTDADLTKIRRVAEIAMLVQPCLQEVLKRQHALGSIFGGVRPE